MGMKTGLITSLIQVFLMAVTWQIMELGILPSGDFGGKLIVCVVIFMVAKVVGWILGSD